MTIKMTINDTINSLSHKPLIGVVIVIVNNDRDYHYQKG